MAWKRIEWHSLNVTQRLQTSGAFFRAALQMFFKGKTAIRVDIKNMPEKTASILDVQQM